MSLAWTLAVVLPVAAFVVLVALMLKYIPGLLDALRCNRHEDEKTRERIDLEAGGGVLSPEPYHMTWPTPSQPHSPFSIGTPKAATHLGLQAIETRVERPPRSPRVMTSLVSPIRTGCSPPKKVIRGPERATLPQSPVVIASSRGRPVAAKPLIRFGQFV
jgi:hypothetical protein